MLGPTLYLRYEKQISPYRFTYLLIVVGTAGMGIIMLPFPSFIAGLGIIALASMVVALPLWHAACNASASGHG